MGEATETRAAVERVVQDHAGWVFAAAKRRVGDAALAEDVTQAVFLLYWRKGMAIGQQGKRTGWLYRAVRYCAANALRLKKIRQRHEREAAMTRQQDQQGAAGWSEIEGELEGAMDRLSEKDRRAVVLRFYRGLSLREVGEALGLGEDAARMRVERAVGKLRGKLAARGVEAETVGLSGLLLAHAGKGEVEGLVEKVMGGMGSNVAGGIAHGAGKMMVMAKMKVAAVVVGVLAGIGGAVAIEMTSEGAARPVVATTRAATAPSTADLTADDAAIREAVIARWQSLQSVTAEYDSVCTWYPPEKSVRLPNGGMLEVKDGMIRLPGSEWIKPIGGTRASRNAFRYLEERAYYDSVLTEATVQDLKRQGEPDVVKREAYAFSAERAEQLTEHTATGPPAGVIGGSIMLPKGLTSIDVALGMRLLEEDAWMDLDRLKEAVIGRDGLGRPTVTFRGERGWVHTWVLDQGHQNAIVRYTVASTGMMAWEIECEGFQEVSGVMLPHRITDRRFSRYAPAGIAQERREDVTRYTVNDQTNTPGSYLMVWPKGSTVLYSPLDATLTVASGDRTLPDEFIRGKFAARIAQGAQLPKRAATTQRTARPVGNGR